MIAHVGALAAGTAALAAALAGMTGTAAPATSTAYADWTLTGASGTMTIPVTGFPSATFTTDSTSPSIQDGTSTYLTADTPFGAVFGSSRGEQYALLRTAAHLAPSTTTFTFQTPAPASRWGFALGDIDADRVTISGTNAAGAPVSGADLGYQSNFNYCAVSPHPSGCGTGPFTDKPTWDEGTATLAGSSSDSSGAAAWFRPAVRLKTLTFTFSRSSGSPSYQVWFAAMSATISGRVRTISGRRPPSTRLDLLHVNGSPVRDPDGRPVTTTTVDDGSYAFTGIAHGYYVVAIVPPLGFAADGPARVAVDTTHGDASGVDFALREVAPAVPMVPVTG